MTVEFHIIERQTKISFGLLEAFKSRELLWMLVQRQISSRYRQMFLGLAWIALEPLAQVLMLSIVFGFLLRVDTEGYPYPLFTFTGLIGWWLFSRNLVAAAGCLQENMGLISKVYFPRLILAIAVSLKELFDSMVMLFILLLVAVIYGFMPTLKIVVLIPLMIFSCFLSLGIGLWVAGMMVRFRDVRPILGLILQAGMYATPIVYASTLVPERFMYLYQLNPMYWVVEFSRWALLSKVVEITVPFFWSLGFSIAIIIGGLLVFSAAERVVVDVQ